MSELRSAIDTLVRQLVGAVTTAVTKASIDDFAERMGEKQAARPRGRRVTGSASGEVEPVSVARGSRPRTRRVRATTEEVQRQKDAALRAAKSLPGGFSKGDVMKKAGSQVDLGRALSLLVAEGKLTRKGDRRLARYWVK